MAVVLILFLGGTAGADPKTPGTKEPLTPEHAAHAVREAIRAGDGESLETLAARHQPDPWLVADELCRREESAAARALAEAAPPTVMEGLAAYLDGRIGRADSHEDRELLERIEAAREVKDWAALLAAGAPASPVLDAVPRILIAYGRGVGHLESEDYAAAEATFERVAEAAKRLRWNSRVAAAWHAVGVVCFRRKEYGAAIPHFERARGERQRMGDRVQAASSLRAVARCHQMRGDGASTLACRAELLELGSDVPWPSKDVSQAADLTLAAVRADDSDALQSFGAKLHPDPWLVADELIARGEREAALAYARATRGKDTEGLPAYLASEAAVAGPTLREVLERIVALGRDRDAEGVLSALAGVEDGAGGVVSLRLRENRGWALNALGRHRESSEAYLDVARGAERIGWRRRAASAFYWSAEIVAKVPDPEAALARRVARLAVEEARGNRIGVASALKHIGRAHYRAGRWDQALPYHRRELALREELDQPADTATVLASLGYVYARLGNPPEARSAYERSLALREKLEDAAGVASVLLRLVDLHAERGEWELARPHAECEVAIRRRLQDRSGAARALARLGGILHELGDDGAIERLEEALKIRRDLDEPAGIADAIHSLGDVLVKRERYAEALELLDEALLLRREVGDRAPLVRTLWWTGTMHRQLGTHHEALRFHEEALALSRAAGDRRRTGTSLHNVGHVHRLLGNYDEALRCQEAALAITRETGNRFGEASNLCYIGVVLERLGRDEEALRYYEASHRIMGELEIRQGIVATLLNIGSVRQDLGELDEALRCYEETLAISREIGNRGNIGAALFCIGMVLEEKGELEEALRYYQQDLEIEREVGNPIGRAVTLSAMGHLYDKLDRHAEALEAFEQAYRLLQEAPSRTFMPDVAVGLARLHLRGGEPKRALARVFEGLADVAELSKGLAEGEGAGAREGFSGLFDVGYRAAVASGDAGALVRLLERGRAGSLTESLGSRAVLEAAVIPEHLRAELNRVRSTEHRALRAYRVASRQSDLPSIRLARKAWEEARADVSRVARRIEREAKHAAAVTVSAPSDLATIQRSLRPSEALVYYTLTTGQGVATVVRRGAARMISLAASEEIEAAVDALLAGNRYVDPAGVEALRSLLVTPLGLAEDVRRILVSPMDRLGYVPFSLLWPEHEVAYAPSGTTHCLLSGEREARGRSVLALGDPDYGIHVDETALRLRAGNVTRLPSLPATREEVEAIADVRYLGAQATETSLLGALAARDRWRAVHFACHGLVDPERPMLSALALTADEESDGFLTAREILRLRIPADLVVLSACETGTGRIYKTEGIVGLARAFMYAGPPRVLCSLWKVDDDATRALMVKFYEQWNPKDGSKGPGAAAALKRAQEFVRKHERWKHPHYWAAWVLWGLPD